MPMRRAYTLVEVLVVVTILGIVSAVVVPQMLQAGTLGVQAAARMIIADLLFAQNDAVAKQRPRRVIFEQAENRYRVTDEQGETLTHDWRGGDSKYEVDFDGDRRFAGIRLVEVEFDDDGALEFDEMGSPSTGGHVILEYNDERFRIDVASFTGRVTVEKL